MKITISELEIKEAIEQYITNNVGIKVAEDKALNIEMSTTRTEGVVATIEVIARQCCKEAVVEERTAKEDFTGVEAIVSEQGEVATSKSIFA